MCHAFLAEARIHFLEIRESVTGSVSGPPTPMRGSSALMKRPNPGSIRSAARRRRARNPCWLPASPFSSNMWVGVFVVLALANVMFVACATVEDDSDLVLFDALARGSCVSKSPADQCHLIPVVPCRWRVPRRLAASVKLSVSHRAPLGVWGFRSLHARSGVHECVRPSGALSLRRPQKYAPHRFSAPWPAAVSTSPDAARRLDSRGTRHRGILCACASSEPAVTPTHSHITSIEALPPFPRAGVAILGTEHPVSPSAEPSNELRASARSPFGPRSSRRSAASLGPGVVCVIKEDRSP